LIQSQKTGSQKTGSQKTGSHTAGMTYLRSGSFGRCGCPSGMGASSAKFESDPKASLSLVRPYGQL